MDAEFQARVWCWLDKAFQPDVIRSRKQRAQRFLEEAVELVQSMGVMDDMECHAMVDHVYSRDKGAAFQEVGGVAITLCALCSNEGLSVSGCARTEMERCELNTDKIRAKQMAKPATISDHQRTDDPRMSLSMKDVRINEEQREAIPPLRSSKA